MIDGGDLIIVNRDKVASNSSADLPGTDHFVSSIGARAAARRPAAAKNAVTARCRNGRCKFHGGKAPSGRANGAFRTGKFTKQAIEDRIAAKLMREKAYAEFAEEFRYGMPLARKHLNEKLAEADKLANAWMDRFYPRNTRGELFYVPTRRRYRRKRRPTFPGGYPNTNGAGRFTKAAKAARAEIRARIAMVGVKLRMAKIARKAVAKSDK
jgi:hypothetical protein